jgi:cobalt-zinc-cadmium efflux system protein
MPAHAHSDHGHHHPTVHDEHRLLWAMLFTGVFMVAEVIGGWLSGSLALLADAGHMFTDLAALLLAWSGLRLSQRPPDLYRTYGYHRYEVLAAFVNGLALCAIVGWIAWEAVQRLLYPVAVLGQLMLPIAILGAVVNLIVLGLLRGGDHANLNLRGALLHVAGDLLGSVAAIGAALVILATGWTPIDPLLSLLVCGLILHSAWELVRVSSHILLEGAPHDLDYDHLAAELQAAVTTIQDVHHVHAWSLTPRRTLLTLHVTVAPDGDLDRVLVQIKAFLARRGIAHSTVQVERATCPDTDAPHHCHG